jgi:ABC-type multidrug transport system fused ATPase/permease subunit
MRRAFRSATQLTVAHRLATVADCDKILVMAAGRVAEYGPPAQLASAPGGAYASLLAESEAGGH